MIAGRLRLEGTMGAALRWTPTSSSSSSSSGSSSSNNSCSSSSSSSNRSGGNSSSTELFMQSKQAQEVKRSPNSLPKIVPPLGLEPTTTGLRGSRSNH